MVIPPIINHPWILDMRPELSVIRRFCERGFEVYMVGWNSKHRQEIGFYDMVSYLLSSRSLEQDDDTKYG